jgi:CHAT domain-containing protein
VEAETNLNEAVRLYQTARPCFAEGSPDYGSVLMNEATARLRLAERGVEAENNLDEAVRLYEKAGEVAESGGNLDLTVRTRHARARLLRRLHRSGARSGTASVPYDSLLEEAHADYARALDAVETMRRLIPRSEEQRRKLLEEHAPLYREMVDLCVELEKWEEAWHWAEMGKLRTLLDLLGDERERLRLDTDEKKQAFDEWQAAQLELFDVEEMLRRRQNGNGHHRGWGLEVGGWGLAARGSGETTQENWQEQAEKRRTAQEKESRLFQRFKSKLEEGRDLVSVDVPKPAELAAKLRELAGLTSDQLPVTSDHSPQRPLLVEFFLLDNDRYCVFLLPLWEVDERPQGARLRVGREGDSPAGEGEAPAEPVGSAGASPSRLPLRVKTENLTEGTMANVLQTFGVAVAAANAGFAGRNRARGEEEAETKDLSEEEKAQLRQRALAAFDQLPKLMGDAFIAPWADALNELKPTELILVGNGVLHLLPLHLAQVNGKKLIEQYPLVYMPSATLSDNLVKKREEKTKDERRKTDGVLPALVMGPPEKDLGGAIAEVKEVADHFGVEPYQFDKMKIAFLREHAGKTGWAHLATHSRFDYEDFMNSEILFHGGEKLRLSLLFTDPSLEMRGMDHWFEGSCESAANARGRTDELMGFVRGLIYAGARSVMATLWPVDDGAAHEFAKCFYFHLKEEEGKTRALAYQEAVQDLLNDRQFSNPYFSAPFVLFGDALVD